jgi:hypothetical protein
MEDIMLYTGDQKSKRVYNVNLTDPDPRTVKTIRRALKWCDLHLSDWKPRQIYASEIVKAFGPEQEGRIGKYLRDKLLEQTDSYLSSATAKQRGMKAHPASYVLNKPGYEELISRFGPLDDGYADAFPTHAAELKCLEFEYSLKSDRYWHGLQNIRREKKRDFWTSVGLPHNYDIEACAPTILLQLAQRKEISALVSEPIAAYLADRQKLRQHVADLTGLSVNEAKQLINSFFNGAGLAKTNYCTAFVQYGANVVERLMKDKEVRLLRVAIRAMWMHIRRGEMVAVEKAGMTIHVRNREKVRKSKDKWAIYFRNERVVMDNIKTWLGKHGVKHFSEHDGFRTNVAIDVAALETEIESATGFALKIEEEL